MGSSRKFRRQKVSILDERRSQKEADVMLEALQLAGLIERKGDMVRVIHPPGGEAEVEQRISQFLDSMSSASEPTKPQDDNSTRQ